MSKLEVHLPQWGMGMSEGTVVTWLKKVGDAVEEDEPLCEVETAKVVEVVEAPGSGTLSEIVVQEGESAEVRSVIAVLETDA